MNNYIKNKLHHIKNRYAYKQLDQINQKHLNYFLRKKYRYEKLGMKEKVEECDAYISLYNGCFLDFIDYTTKKRKKEFEKIAYLLLLIKQEKESLIKNNEKSSLKLQSKSLYNLTEKEAVLVGKNEEWENLIYDIFYKYDYYCSYENNEIDDIENGNYTPKDLETFYLNHLNQKRK